MVILKIGIQKSIPIWTPWPNQSINPSAGEKGGFWTVESHVGERLGLEIMLLREAAMDANLGGHSDTEQVSARLKEPPTVCLLAARRKTVTPQWRDHTTPNQTTKVNKASEVQMDTVHLHLWARDPGDTPHTVSSGDAQPDSTRREHQQIQNKELSL